MRICYYNTWAKALEDAAAYVARVPTLDIAPLVADAGDAALHTKARLDCDWYGENARCFASLSHPALEFLPAWVAGKEGLLEMTRVPHEPGEERWLITMGQQPQGLEPVAGKVFEFLARNGVRHLYYAFDEASRTMPCFPAISPHLRVLIHDEAPLHTPGQAALAKNCLVQHRSWVANVLPFAEAFVENPVPDIVFLGSQLGLTPHRQRQIDFLRKRFGARFTAIHDHSLAVRDRGTLARRFAVSVCPEGRKFATPAMSATHTDRPFWSGCLGLVPVSEDSAEGGRLEALHRAGLLVRYPRGDLDALAAACERAIALGAAERRRIYEHYNRHETVGAVAAEAIAAAH